MSIVTRIRIGDTFTYKSKNYLVLSIHSSGKRVTLESDDRSNDKFNMEIEDLEKCINDGTYINYFSPANELKLDDIITFSTEYCFNNHIFKGSSDFKARIKTKSSIGINIEVLQGQFYARTTPERDYQRKKGYTSGSIAYNKVFIIKKNEINETQRIITSNTRTIGSSSIGYKSRKRIVDDTSKYTGNKIKYNGTKTKIKVLKISPRAQHYKNC